MLVLSVLIIGLLAFAMIAAVQIFTISSGPGHVVLDVRGLLQGIREEPLKWEYAWVYALIFSTQFPSLLNLSIGATALFRGLPGLHRWCLARLPEHGKIAAARCHGLAIALALQSSAGLVCGILAQVGLGYLVLFLILPFCGIELLELAQSFAALFPV